ncbi:MAG TPA: DciA family protein [Gammaproteobacteria bacterium]|nr:DciA family protein [Gammaproteobacteria bacterium]
MPSQSSRETTPLKLSEAILDNDWFRKLKLQLKQVEYLQTLFLKAVDWELGQHCQILEFSSGRLSLAVSNANWATHVRYHTPELIKLLRLVAEFRDLKSIFCYVHPDPKDIKVGLTTPPNPIPEESAASIAEVAKGIKDIRLKNALLKLANKLS